MKAVLAGAASAAMLALLSAGAAHAQDGIPGSVFSLGSLDEYLRSGRNRELNPTGFGKPGEYWSVPTGSRIARGIPPKPKAEASAKPAAGAQGAMREAAAGTANPVVADKPESPNT